MTPRFLDTLLQLPLFSLRGHPSPERLGIAAELVSKRSDHSKTSSSLWFKPLPFKPTTPISQLDNIHTHIYIYTHMCLLVILWPVLLPAHTNYKYLEEPIKDGIGQHDNTTTPVLTGKLRNNTLQ